MSEERDSGKVVGAILQAQPGRPDTIEDKFFSGPMDATEWVRDMLKKWMNDDDRLGMKTWIDDDGNTHQHLLIIAPDGEPIDIYGAVIVFHRPVKRREESGEE